MNFKNIFDYLRDPEKIIFFFKKLNSFLLQNLVNVLIGVCCFLMILLLFLIFWPDRQKTIYNQSESQEYLNLDYKLNIKEYSDNFFNILNVDKNNLINSLQENYLELHRLFTSSLKYKHSFTYAMQDRPYYVIVNYTKENIQIHITLNSEYILHNLPVPLSIDLGSKKIVNKAYNQFGNLLSTEFFIKGQYFEKKGHIYKLENINVNNLAISGLFPIMSQEDFVSIKQDSKSLPPLPICVINKSGEILKQTETFKKFFNLKDEVSTFQDLLESIRSYILHNEVFFADFKKYFLNLFSNLNNIHEEQYSTVDGRVIQFKFIPHNKEIVFMLQDITSLSVNKIQENLFRDCKNKIFPMISDFIIISNTDGIVEMSNCEIIQIGEKISTAKTILKFFATPESGVQEINLSNNSKCLFVKISIKDKIFKVRNYISQYLDKILKILNLLNNTIDGSLGEYLKYIRFITINVENQVKTLELGVNKNYQSTSFDIVHEINNIKNNLEKSLTFKNLIFNINDQSLDVINSKESILCLIENLFLIAFKYQFNEKTFTLEEKDQKIYITLTGINKEEVEKIYTMFDLINNLNIFSNIKEQGDKISIGFYFDKVSHLK